MKIFNNSRFVFVWISAMMLTLGFSIFFLSISWLTIDVLNKPSFLGVILTAVSLPRLIMMIFGGVFADRFQKSRILFFTGIGQTILMLLVITLYFNNIYSTSILLIISIFFGMLDGISHPAFSSLLPSIVPSFHLQKANSLFQGSLELMFVIGPFLAGILLTHGGFGLSFGIAAIFLLIASFMVAPYFIGDTIPKSSNLTLKQILFDLKEGVLYVNQTPVLKSGTLSIAIVNLFVMGPIIMSIPILVGARNGVALDLSIIEGGLAIGTFTASLFFLLLQSVNRGRFVFRALFLTLGTFLLYTQAQSISLLAITAAMSGFLLMFVYLPTVTIMQEESDSDKIGRVMSIMAIAAAGLEPIAFALLSILVSLSYPIQPILFSFGIIGLICSFILYLKSKLFRKTI